MKLNYTDITSRISEPPTWWDDNGTPRYGEFHPDQAPCIYADEVVLFKIQCQACKTPFNVTKTWYRLDGGSQPSQKIPHLYYGDPPNADCCPAGPTMSSDSIHVLQFWEKRSNPYGWIRRFDLEVDLEDAFEETSP